METKPLEPAFPIQQQLGHKTVGPVVLMNVFTMTAEDECAFLDVWEADAAFMKSRPGFISAQLHRAIGPSPCYYNAAVWESVDAFRAAFLDPSFQAKMSAYPASVTAAPHLFQRVAVSNICVT